MAKIDISADTAQVQAALAQLNASLDASNDRIKTISQSMGVFNAQGVQTQAVIKGVTEDGKSFSASLGLLTQAQQKLAASGVAVNLSLKNIAFKETAKDVEDVDKKTSAFANTLNRVGRNLVQFASYRAFSLVTQEIAQGIQAAKDFEIQISLIRTISQDKQLSFNDFAEGIRRTSNASGIDINKVGKAFYDTTSNQVAKGADVETFVKSAAEFARTTGSEIPDAVNLLSSAINAYGLSVKDADRLSAIFFRTIDEGRVVASELANTFGRVAVLGSNLGVDLEDLNAVLAITTQKGFKTSDAMTLLTNLLIKLEKPTEATKAFFQTIGVDTGEAAVKLLGFSGVLRKMVELVQSGQVDVSAFFDEIRGRKQFGVFQQSIDQIEDFSNKLKNTQATLKTYQDAVEIRGESPADKLQKEFNKLGNVFKVDLGQAVLKGTADVLSSVGGVDQIIKIMPEVANAFKIGAASVVAYTAVNYGLISSNNGATVSFARVGAAASAATKVLAFAAVAYSSFTLAKNILGTGQENLFGEVNPENLNKTADTIERLTKAAQAFKAQGQSKFNPLADFDTQGKVVSDSFRTVGTLIANANIVNNKFLDDAKQKSRDVAETVKNAFAGYADTIKTNITELKKGITEANTEIEKSRKFTLSLGDTIDQVILKSQMRFADDGQKVDLLEGKITRNIDKIRQLYKSGDEKQVEEARNLAKETIQDIASVSEQKQEIAKKNLEEYLRANPLERSPYGKDVFVASTEEEQKRLFGLKAILEDLERVQRTRANTTIETNKEAIKSEEARLRLLQDAFKAYEQLDVFEKGGSVKADYKDKLTGKFDPTKLSGTLDALENNIRTNFQGTFAERLQLEVTLSQKRGALTKEVNAQERADYLKTTQQRVLGEEEAYKKRIETLKSSRDTEIANQASLFAQFTQKQDELRAFANKFGEGGGTTKDQRQAITDARQEFTDSLVALRDNKINRDGIEILDPERARVALEKYQAVIRLIQSLRDQGNQTDLTIKDANQRNITPGGGVAAAQDLTDQISKSYLNLQSNLTQTKAEGSAFDLTIKKPVEELKSLFPELAQTADGAIKGINQNFKDLANGGIQDLINQLKEVQKLMPQFPGKIPGVGAADFGGGEVYAATGGIVGLFPGQPRGVDKYPIWAAKGERIISAETSAMYAPMLDAIMSRRMPRYMAQGGVVGDTNIGDINVTVNGGSTNADTGRIISQKLSREFRRRNISFNPRS